MFFFTTLPLSAHAVLAHQGGWDEILWVLATIAVMVWLLRVASQRIRSDGATTEATDAQPASEPNDVGPEI